MLKKKGYRIKGDLLAHAISSSWMNQAQLQKVFNRLADNKIGRILASYNRSSLSCGKLAHYLPVYQRLLGKFSDSRVNMFEIGVQHGGSYQLWSNFFGEDLLCWTGLDIEPNCLKLNDRLDSFKAKVFSGSQTDHELLQRVSEERGPFDIIIDDGSHKTDHVKKSFEVLCKYVKPGGVYIVEDVHASYWEGFRGSGEHVSVVSYFQKLLHSLNSQALESPRRAKDVIQEEILKAPAPMNKIEFLPSMIICHMGEPDPLIEWRAGSSTIQDESVYL